jgi:hypothetical protein
MTQRHLPNAPIHDTEFSYAWREWLRRTHVRVTGAAQILWSQIDKAGSNLTEIVTRRHRDLQDLQGGTTAEYYHLTSAQHIQYTEVAAFFAATDMTGAEAETLTDGSVADSLHIHTAYANDILLTSGDALVTDGSGNVIIGVP